MKAFAFTLVLLVACKDKPAADTAAAAGVTDFSDPLALVPADSDMIMKLDLGALRKSALWRTYQHDVLMFLAPTFARCNYNPFDEITTITAGFPGGAKQGMFVIRNIDRDKATKCLRESKAETNTTVAFDGDFITLTNKSGAVNLLLFVDAKTLVMQGSKNPTKTELTAALGMGAPLRKDPAMVAALAKLSPTAALTFVSRPGSRPMAEGLEQKLGVPATGFHASLEATDRLALRSTVELTSAADATAAIQTAQAQLDQAKEFFETVSAKADGANVVVEISATEAQIKALVELAKTLMPE